MGNHMKRSKRRSFEGFTILEIMIVLVILGILSTFAVNLMFRYRARSQVATLHSDLANVYKAASLFYNENAGEEITLADLYQYGFSESNGVVIEILDGNQDSLIIRATHPDVTGIYRVDSKGRISKE
jgi:prepilin-type N-terminal cleavage/methylation domain-containing protein